MTAIANRLPVVPCAGVPITACTRTQAAELVIDMATSPRHTGVDIHLCNAYTLALADSRRSFGSLLRRAAVNFPDGKSVVWANQLRHRHLDLPSERVYGPDLFQDVFELGQQVQLRHYLLGSTWEALTALDRRLRQLYPDALLVGTDSPPFRELSEQELRHQADRIRWSEAQVVWVGLGTPKQDIEVARLARQLPMVFVAVGAAFEFVAGTKRQAPLMMRDNGLEWLFRLGAEPRRLWKRYLFGNARFLYAASRHRVDQT